MFKGSSRHLATFAAVAVLLASSGLVTAQKPSTKTAKRSAPAAARVPPTVLELEPKAIDVLKAASKRLAAARTLSFVAVETYESLSRQGAPLVYAHKSEVTLQRPDKLRAILSGDGPSSEFYYDGKTMMAFAPAENAVVVADAPPTIDAALEDIYHKAAVYFPFTDLIVADPYGDLAPGLKHAYTSDSPVSLATRPRTSSRTGTKASSRRCGSGPTTDCHAWYTRSISTTPKSCAAT